MKNNLYVHSDVHVQGQWKWYFTHKFLSYFIIGIQERTSPAGLLQHLHDWEFDNSCKYHSGDECVLPPQTETTLKVLRAYEFFGRCKRFIWSCLSLRRYKRPSVTNTTTITTTTIMKFLVVLAILTIAVTLVSGQGKTFSVFYLCRHSSITIAL